MGVKEVANRYPELLKRFEALRKPKIAVGVFEADGQAEASGGVSLIQVAVWNEYGTETIPSRSFLRAWFDENLERARAALVLIIEAAVKGDGELDVKKALERFGLWVQGEIQARIAKGISPANAPSTIAKKGSSTPLINTGQLRSSITFAIDWGSGELKPVKSAATKGREAKAKVAAKEAKKAIRRKAALKHKARKAFVRRQKKAVKRVTKSVLRDTRRGARSFLKKTKRAIRRATR